MVTTGDAKVKIENCGFRQLGDAVPMNLRGASLVEVYGGVFDRVIEEEISDLVEYVEETTNNEEQEENNNKYNIDFATLKEKNSDTVGYLKVNGTDRNVIMYGHNMRNNTMFGTLKNVLNEEWKDVEENRFITFITEEDSYIYSESFMYGVERGKSWR